MWGCDYGEGAAEGGFDFGIEVVAGRDKGACELYISCLSVWVGGREGWGNWLRKEGKGRGDDGFEDWGMNWRRNMSGTYAW